jgi:N-acetylmuramoyl-L-alanine amidase
VVDVASATPVEVIEPPDTSGITPDFPPDYPALPDLPSLPGSVSDPEKFRFTVVVIDAGHGGKDRGACGRGGLCEKDVVLEIALGLKKLLAKRPGIKVVLTRTSDYFVPLKERTAIANHANNGLPGDVFISIHTNAHKSQKVGGFECFYISDAIDPDAEATAVFENAVINLEVDDEATRSALTPILWDLQFTEFVSQSSELAALTQQELADRLNTRDRGVRQAQFIVLAGVAMPSILIEVGFISNRIEESKLKTADFRGKCAEAIAEAVLVFKRRRDEMSRTMGRKTQP